MIHLYPLNELISNLMPATGLKKLARVNKGLKKQDILKRFQLGEHLATNYINWPQVYHMISYKARVHTKPMAGRCPTSGRSEQWSG